MLGLSSRFLGEKTVFLYVFCGKLFFSLSSIFTTQYSSWTTQTSRILNHWRLFNIVNLNCSSSFLLDRVYLSQCCSPFEKTWAGADGVCLVCSTSSTCLYLTGGNSIAAMQGKCAHRPRVTLGKHTHRIKMFYSFGYSCSTHTAYFCQAHADMVTFRETTI